MLLLLLPLLANAAPSPASGQGSSSGSSGVGGMVAAGVAGTVLGMALAPSPDCEDVGIDRSLCAVLYDEEKCSRSGAILTRGLRRNDVESLIVRNRCKLELWDNHDGLEKGEAPDLVIDRTPWYVVGNKEVDSLDDDYESMNEAISAYRCTCRESMMSKMWG